MVYGMIVKCQISYLRGNRKARHLQNDVRTIYVFILSRLGGLNRNIPTRRDITNRNASIICGASLCKKKGVGSTVRASAAAWPRARASCACVYVLCEE